MYLKLDIDNVKIELNDIIKFFENRYHLNPYWYEKKDGCIYEEIREHYEERIYLDAIHKKAYDIYRQIEALEHLEYESNRKKDKE